MNYFDSQQGKKKNEKEKKKRKELLSTKGKFLNIIQKD